MRPPTDVYFSEIPSPRIRRIDTAQPFRWLQLGWRDLRRSPVASLAYGLLFAICGDILLLLVLPYPHLFMAAVSGFFLVAPLLAAGLYEISRRLAAGQAVTFVASLGCWRGSASTLAFLGLLLALVVLAWERLSAALFGLVLGDRITDVAGFFGDVLSPGSHTPIIVAWFLVGAALALAVFAATAVAVPMIVDRQCDVATALAASLRAVTGNPRAMLLWALVIVALTLLGFATLLFGLIVFMPVIGHASWHAYRDLVG